MKATIQYSIESVVNFVISAAEQFSDSTKDKNFEYLKRYKARIGLKQNDSVDIVIVYKTWDKHVAELQNRINYKLSDNSKVGVFFKGGKNKEYFLMPFNFNILLESADSFMQKMRSEKMNPIALVNLEIKNFGMFEDILEKNKKSKKLNFEPTYLHLQREDKFDLDKHVLGAWSNK